MRISILAPYSQLGRESGAMYLLSNYLKTVHPEMVQLRCNGVFSTCGRDAELSWKRDLDSCHQCIAEQKNLALWSSLALEDLSRYLDADTVARSRRISSSESAASLALLEWDGVRLLDLVRGTFHSRFGPIEPDYRNRSHEIFLRRLLLGSARMLSASKNFLEKFHPEVTFVAGHDDLISASFLAAARNQKSRVVVFQWEPAARAVTITDHMLGKKISCELLIENILKIRADVKTWSLDLMDILSEISKTLEIPTTTQSWNKTASA